MRTRPSLRTLLLLALALSAAAAPATAQDTEWLQSTAAEQMLGDPNGIAAKRRPPLEVRSQSGFDHRGRGCLPGSWTPVTVWSRNNTDHEMYATLKLATLTPEGASNGSKVQVPLRLPPHRIVMTKSVVWVAPSDTRLDVQVVSSTGETGQDTQALLAPPRFKRAFVVIGATHPGPEGRTKSYPHDDLARGGLDAGYLTPTFPLAGQLMHDYADHGSNVRWMVFHPVLRTLPDRWIAYSGIRAVVVTDPALVAQMSPAQWSALLTYVRAGGQLFFEIDSEADLEAAKHERLANLLPARLEPALACGPGLILGHSAGDERATIPYCPVNPKFSGGREIRQSGIPLAASAPEGLGTVGVIGFSLAAPELTRADAGYPSLVRRVLEDGLTDGAADALRQQTAPQLAKQLNFSMKSEELAQIPSHRVLLAFLAGYCLLLSPLGRAIAGRSGRPLVTWLVLPLIVLTFIGIANVKLSIKRPQIPLLREISVVQARDGAATGLWRSYLTLYSPHQAIYRVDEPSPDVSLAYLTYTENRGLNRDVLGFADGVAASELDPKTPGDEVKRAAPFRLDALPVAPRSTTALEAVAPVSLGAGIRVEDEKGAYTVTNGSSVDLERGFIITRRETVVEVPLVRSRSTVRADNTAGSALPYFTDGARDQKVIDGVMAALKGVRARPLLIAWARRPAADLTFSAPDGAADGMSHSALTFYVIHPRGVSQ